MTTTTQTTKAPTKRDLYLASTIELTDKGSTNPKKKGSQSWTRYQGYFAALDAAMEIDENNPVVTVQMAYDHGVRGDDIRHDVEHGHITLTPPSSI